MNGILLIIYLLFAAVLGAAFLWLLLRSRTDWLARRKTELEQELAGTKLQLQQMQAELTTVHAARAAAEATLESERKQTLEKIELLSQAGDQMKGHFASLVMGLSEFLCGFSNFNGDRARSPDYALRSRAL